MNLDDAIYLITSHGGKVTFGAGSKIYIERDDEKWAVSRLLDDHGITAYHLMKNFLDFNEQLRRYKWQEKNY